MDGGVSSEAGAAPVHGENGQQDGDPASQAVEWAVAHVSER